MKALVILAVMAVLDIFGWYLVDRITKEDGDDDDETTK